MALYHYYFMFKFKDKDKMLCWIYTISDLIELTRIIRYFKKIVKNLLQGIFVIEIYNIYVI